MRGKIIDILYQRSVPPDSSVCTFSTSIGERIIHREIKINIDWTYIVKSVRERLLPFILLALCYLC